MSPIKIMDCFQAGPAEWKRGEVIELYYRPTPNGHKITSFLEEVTRRQLSTHKSSAAKIAFPRKQFVGT
jgi:hypothetical protein